MALPVVIGSDSAMSSSSSASEEITAIAGSFALSAPAISPTVAANRTSCPKPSIVCARPSRRATSAPTRITLATRELSSVSQPLNGFQVDSANLDQLRSRRVAGNDAHIAPRNFQSRRKKIDECLVRHSLDRRSCDAHLQEISLRADDFVSG